MNKLLLILCSIFPVTTLASGGGSFGGGSGGGINSINSDLSSSQSLSVGTSGTDFAISNPGSGSHIFNLPSASATARGLVTTGAQTIAGAKTLSTAPICSSLTASTVPYLDAGKQLASSSVTPTELGYLSGVSSAIQTQINAKSPAASPTFTGTVTLPTGAGVLRSSSGGVVSSAELSGDVTTSGTNATTVAKIQSTTVSGTTGTGNVAFSASPTFTGTAIFASGTLSGTWKLGNYHLEPGENDSGNSSTTQTIDWSSGSSQLSTLTGNVTYTFSNPQAGGAYVLRIATGAGSFTATWPGTVKWPGGTAPTITTTASKVDLINFYYDGTNYYGSFTQNY